MSFKDGIPLLTSFEDDTEDDFMIDTIAYPRRKNKRHIIIGVLLTFVVIMVTAVIISVSLAFTLKSSGSSRHPSDGSSNGSSKVDSLVSSSFLPASSPGNVATNSVGTLSSSAPVVPNSSSRSMVGSDTTPIIASSSMVEVILTSSMIFSASSQVLESPSPSTQMMSPSSTQVESPTPSPSTQMESPSSTQMMSPTPSPSTQMESPPSTQVESPTPSPSTQVESPPSTQVELPSSTQMELPPSTQVELPPSSTQMMSPTPSPSTQMELPPSTQMESPPSTQVESPPSTQVMSPTPSPTPPPCPLYGQCSDDITLCPSQKDTRAYNFTILDNGLRVVLISDPSTDLAGASMNVAAGSFNDPSDYTGLAHFCEHMLFLGTETFPDKHEYSGYLSTHGGYDNAYTDNQETNYHFSVGAGYLNHSLDLFSHFFIDPLFVESLVMDEMNAVNQEYEKDLLSDDWILQQLLKTVSNPHHPYSQFNIGNFNTLNHSDTRDQLLAYYHATYSASTMNLAVYGREELPVLYEMVDLYFSKINNTGVVPIIYNTTAFPQGSNYTCRIVYYLSQADVHVLTLYWQTPSLQAYPQNSVGDFLTRYLGHEGEGSLLYYLQTNGLATSLLAGVEVSTESFYLFKLQITLTRDGLDSVSDVIKYVFQFARLLADLKEEEFQEKWTDYVNVMTINFDYAENESPNKFAVGITRVMRVVNSAGDVLPNPRRFICNYTLTVSTAKYFTPNNSIIFISTKNISSLQDKSDSLNQVPKPGLLDEVEPFFMTNYSIVEVSRDLLTYWSSDGTEEDFKLADTNMFIPSNISEIYSSNETIPSSTNHSGYIENYFLTDAKNFSSQPRVNFICELKTENSQITATWQAYNEMYVALVKAVLKPHLYSATNVGYSYDLTSSPRGLILEFGGLSDTGIIQRLVHQTMTKILNPVIAESDNIYFDLALSETRDILSNYNYTALPFHYTHYYIQNIIMERPYWKNEQILSALESLSLTQLRDFYDTSLLRNLSVVCLSHGNVNYKAAVSYATAIMDHLTDRFSTTPSPDKEFPRTRVTLEQVGTYGVSLPAFNPVDKNSVVQVIYQAGSVCNVMEDGTCSDESLIRSLHLSLLHQVIYDACFTQLRTVEKLGYVVFCSTAVNQGIGSFQSLVQSVQATPEHVLNSTLSFLDSFYHDIMLSPEFESSFSDNVDVLRESLEGRDLKLKDKTDKLWNEIISGRHQYDYNEQMIASLGKLNYQGFVKFYNETILNEESYRRLMIIVNGRGKNFTPRLNYPVDYYSLNQTQHVLPTPP